MGHRHDTPGGPMTGNPGGPMKLAENRLQRSHAHGRRPHLRSPCLLASIRPVELVVSYDHLLRSSADAARSVHTALPPMAIASR